MAKSINLSTFKYFYSQIQRYQMSKSNKFKKLLGKWLKFL